jgi:hypothetical protein
MAFDPSLPANNSSIISSELRNQFNGLKALIDGLQAQVDGLLPIGIIVGWPKSLSGVPSLPGTWVECNGQVLSDGASPLDGQTIPDLNHAQAFLRGALTSGGMGGATSHGHTVDLTGASAGDPGSSGGLTVHQDIYPTSITEHLPPYYEVVFVMRVK